MQDNLKHKILLLINHNGSISELIKDGYTYGQIATFINELSESKFIYEVNDRLELTELGNSWIIGRSHENQKTGTDKWILPEEKSRISKISKDEVYLPNRNELHF